MTKMVPALWGRSEHDTCRRVMSLHKAARCCRISARGGCTDHLSGELPYPHAVCGGSSGMEAWETAPPSRNILHCCVSMTLRCVVNFPQRIPAFRHCNGLVGRGRILVPSKVIHI